MQAQYRITNTLHWAPKRQCISNLCLKILCVICKQQNCSIKGSSSSSWCEVEQAFQNGASDSKIIFTHLFLHSFPHIWDGVGMGEGLDVWLCYNQSVPAERDAHQTESQASLCWILVNIPSQQSSLYHPNNVSCCNGSNTSRSQQGNISSLLKCIFLPNYPCNK